MFRLYSTLLLLPVLFTSVNGITVLESNETLVTENIISRLRTPTCRPVLDPASIVNVTVSFMLTQIIELNDVLQELKVAGWFLMTWQDERIMWDPFEYDVDCVFIPVNKIWNPDMTLYNNLDEQYNHFPPDAPVQVCFDGSAKYSTYSIFQSSCHINIELYPYDNQTCKLRFGSWNYNVYELDVHPELRELDQKDHFDDNGVWTLQDVLAWREVEEYKSNSNPFAYAVFSIQLKRRYEFQHTFILVPYHFCAFLITLMFFIPFGSDEKLSYGVTVLLGSIVFQQIIALSLPPVGNESSIFGKYFNAVIGIGAISVFLEILLRLKMHEGFLYFKYIFNEMLKCCCQKDLKVDMTKIKIGDEDQEKEKKETKMEEIAVLSTIELFVGFLALLALAICMGVFVSET